MLSIPLGRFSPDSITNAGMPKLQIESKLDTCKLFCLPQKYACCQEKKCPKDRYLSRQYSVIVQKSRFSGVQDIPKPPPVSLLLQRLQMSSYIRSLREHGIPRRISFPTPDKDKLLVEFPGRPKPVASLSLDSLPFMVLRLLLSRYESATAPRRREGAFERFKISLSHTL